MSNQTTRRTFIKLTAAAAATTNLPQALAATPSIQILIDPALANSEPIQWATTQLRKTLTAKSISTTETNPTLTILAALNTSPLATPFKIPNLTQPETIAMIPGTHNKAPAILITGVDTRGLVYGLLELTDRIHYTEDPTAALHITEPVIETTPNKVRSVARAFLSETEDKPWFYDRDFWTQYLDTLAFARFNRFNLALGFGYDFPRGVTGDYLHFPYPYLVELPNYSQVRVDPPLQPGERQRNLETLQFIAAETARRGLHFQLGIWTHAYEWTESPHSDHHILGLTPETHAAYCRDALAAILKACPQISGLTLRIHGESGIPEGSYPFWQTLFEAIPAAGRPIELDLHAKGLDQTMIDIALKTGMPVKAGCKFWAEHQGLGYHQADIRETEYPRKGVTGTFAVSSGERNFTRYGYGDFYGQHQIEIIYRVWPGTQRHLLSGDHLLAAGYGNAAHFCGAAGMEYCDPLTFKGREGSGHPGGRNSYADSALAAFHPDTNKFALTYFLWGRGLYDGDGLGSTFVHRVFRSIYGPCGPDLRMALANSSRILPLITTAWLPSASNHSFWPELYTPTSILPPTGRPLYTDSPAPHNVSAISPLDPQLFSSIDDYAKNLIAGKLDARYNSTEIACCLEFLVYRSTQYLDQARTMAGPRATPPQFRQAEEDILILNGLGLYYANLFRAALLYSIHEQTGDPNAGTQSLAAYRKAREAWATMAKRASAIYTADISYGSIPMRRGHWADRLPAIDKDIADLEQHYASNPTQHSSATKAIEIATEKARRDVPAYPLRNFLPVRFHPPDSFQPGSPLTLQLARADYDNTAILWYRHVNQAERWLSVPMQKTIPANEAVTVYTAVIPADYTNSPYPLQYYFEFRTANDATIYPIFRIDWAVQPYFTSTAKPKS